MLRAIRASNRAKRFLFLGLSCAAIASVLAAAIAACIVAPPADLPDVPAQAPTIDESVVQPSLYNGPLATLPGDGFLVPVRVTDPTRAFTCRVFVDFDPGPTNTGATAAFACPTPTLPALDGGATLIPFFLGPTDLGDPTACHTITFVVTYSFSGMSNHSSGDTLGSHSVVWNYVPANGCYQYDAGDGAPPQDASGDTLLIPSGAL